MKVIEYIVTRYKAIITDIDGTLTPVNPTFITI